MNPGCGINLIGCSVRFHSNNNKEEDMGIQSFIPCRSIGRWGFMAMLLGLAACGGGGSNGGSASAHMSSLGVSLTDSAGCDFDAVWVTIAKVRVHRSASAKSDDPGWIDITPPGAPLLINLLTLQNGLTQSLGVAPLPDGRYNQVRLHLVPNTLLNSNNDYVVIGNAKYPLNIPEGFKNGIVLHPNAPIVIDPGVTEDLVLDFDACQSVAKSKSVVNTYVLRPRVLMVRKIDAGSITGAVDPSATGAIVKAEINGYVRKQTRVRPDGTFTLYPLLSSLLVPGVFPGDPSGTYDVVIEDENHSTVVTTGVPVTAEEATALSSAGQTTPFPSSANIGTLTGAIDPTDADARVRQKINGHPYQIRRNRVELADGSFSMDLNTDAPWFGAFGPLPIGYSADNAAAGKFTLDTPNDDQLYVVASQDFALTAGGTQTINFTNAGLGSLVPTNGTAGTVTGNLTLTSVPDSLTLPATIIVSATMDGENVNSVGVTFASSGTLPYILDDLAPGTYSITVPRVPSGLTLSPSSVTVTIPDTGGTFIGGTLTLSP